MTDPVYKTLSAEGEESISAIRLGIRELEPVVAEVSAFSQALLIISEDARPHSNTIAVLSVELNRRVALIGEYHVLLLELVNRGQA